jgi:hypothetical protein
MSLNTTPVRLYGALVFDRKGRLEVGSAGV